MKASLSFMNSIFNPFHLQFWSWTGIIWSAPWVLLYAQLGLSYKQGVVDWIKIVEFLLIIIRRWVHLCTNSGFGYGFNINSHFLLNRLSCYPMGHATKCFIFCELRLTLLLWQIRNEYRNQRWRFPINWLISPAQRRNLFPGSCRWDHFIRCDSFDNFI